MKKILKLAVILMVICAIVAGVLGAVNFITADRIAEQQAIKTAKAYASVLESESYTDVDYSAAEVIAAAEEGKCTINAVVSADNGAGYVVTLSTSGAQGTIKIAIGVDSNDKCSGISIISHSETSGLGANAASASEVGVKFRAQFVGEDENIALAKKGGNIDALSGATITSTAVTRATATAINIVKTLEGGAAA